MNTRRVLAEDNGERRLTLGTGMGGWLDGSLSNVENRAETAGRDEILLETSDL